MYPVAWKEALPVNKRYTHDDQEAFLLVKKP
jgi:hypothetical protein